MLDSAKRLYAAIAELKKANNVTQTDVAREFNVSSQVVNNWEKRGVPPSVAVQAEEMYGISPAWIINGVEVDRISAPDSESHDGYINIDYYDIKPSAGHGSSEISYPSVKKLQILEDWAFRFLGKNATNNIKLLTNKGVSMHPTIKDGDVLFVDITKTYFDGDGVYIITVDGDLFTKRLIKNVMSTLTVVSDNKAGGYEDLPIDSSNQDKIAICGKVVKVLTLDDVV